MPVSQRFERWGADARYGLVPGGSFELGSAPWTLSGGAKVVDRNETFFVRSAGDSRSLLLPSGSTATTPGTCFTLGDWHLRLLVVDKGSSSGKVRVTLVVRSLLGVLSILDGGTVSAGEQWQPSPNAVGAPPGQVTLAVAAGVVLGSLVEHVRGTLHLERVFLRLVNCWHALGGTAFLLGDVIEADDAYTGSHSRELVRLTLAVADELGLGQRERRDAEFAALLHDIGKVRVPNEIINKPGPLTDEEWAIVERHTIEGERLLHQVGGLLGEIGLIVRSCHEHWDGSGYPDDWPASRFRSSCESWRAATPSTQ